MGQAAEATIPALNRFFLEQPGDCQLRSPPGTHRKSRRSFPERGSGRCQSGHSETGCQRPRRDREGCTTGRPALIEALNGSGSESYYDSVADALGNIGTNPEMAVPALERLYEKSGISSAITALGQFGPDAAPALQTLAGALRIPETRDAASEAIGRIGGAAVPILAQALRDSDEDVREAAALGLVLVGSDASPAAADLSQALADQSPSGQCKGGRSPRPDRSGASEGSLTAVDGRA